MTQAPVRTSVQGAVVFTDLVGFTEYTAIQGDAAAVDLLSTQEEIVQRRLPDGARIVKELGDGLMLWFPDPCVAIEACLALLDEYEEVSDETLIPLWVRMGMHWGVQTVRREDLIGHDVNLASRISDLADAGELMVSQATVEAAREAGASLEFDDMGPTLVKGIPDPVHVFRAVRDF